MSAALDSERSPVRRFGVALLCAKVALVPLVFHQAFDVPFTVPKALLSHALAYVLAGVLLAFVIRYRGDFVRSWLHAPVLAFLLANGLATAFAVDPYLAFYGTHVRMLGLGTVADWVVLYLAASQLLRTRRDLGLLAGAVLLASVPVLAYEAVQATGRDPFLWNVDPTERAFSTIGQATTLAEYLTVLAVGAVAGALTADGIGRRARGALMAYGGVLLLGAAATGTRSVLFGIAGGGVALLLMVWLRHPSHRARRLSVAGAGVAALALAALLLLSPLGGRVASTVQIGTDPDDGLNARLEPSAAGRAELYGIAARIVVERPLLGYGPDSFVLGVPRYRPPAASDPVRQSLATSAHSWVTQVASTSGLLGLAAFVAVPLVAFVLAFRAPFRAPTVVALAMLAAFLGAGLTTVTDIATDWLFWCAAGVIAATTGTSGVEKTPPALGRAAARSRARARRSAPIPASRWVVAVPLVGGVLFALTVLPAADASRLAKTSESRRLEGSPAEAIARGLDATRADPHRAEYWHRLGLAYVSASRMREASAAFERTTALAPYVVRYIGDHATAELLLAGQGDAGARVRALRLGDRAAQLDTNNPRAHLIRATVRQALGDPAEALRSAEHAVELDPGSTNPRLYVTTTQLLVAERRPADAAALARTGLQILGEAPQSVPLRVELARALFALGRSAEAVAELDAALRIAPNERTVQQLRSQILAGM